MRMTEEEYQKLTSRMPAATPHKPKYGNHKVIVDGITFDSKRELARWNQLKILVNAGHISDLKRQVPFEIVPSVVLDGKKKPSVRYIADFTYQEAGYLIIEDVKSDITRKCPTYRLKKHLVKHVHGIEIKES